MAKYYDNQGSFSIEHKIYNDRIGITHGNMERVQLDLTQPYNLNAIIHELWWQPDEFYQEDWLESQLVLSRWYVTRKGSRKKHLEQTVVKNWAKIQFLGFRQPEEVQS